MARRKEHSHDEIRKLAITATMDRLAYEPMQEISLRQIANAIGYAPSTLVKVFGSYHYLLLACSANTLMALLHELNQLEDTSSGSRLLMMANRYYDYALANPHLFNLVFELKMEADEALPQSQLSLISLLLSKLEKEISLIVPHLKAGELEAASRNFWSMIHGITVLSLKDKLFCQSLDAPSLLTMQVETFIAGLLAQYDNKLTPHSELLTHGEIL